MRMQRRRLAAAVTPSSACTARKRSGDPASFCRVRGSEYRRNSRKRRDGTKQQISNTCRRQ